MSLRSALHEMVAVVKRDDGWEKGFADCLR